MLVPRSFSSIKPGKYFCVFLFAALAFVQSSHATTVQVQTSLGDFEIILFDDATPATVANFLDYVEAGAYTDSIFHRSISGFVIQGGGYTFVENGPPEPIATADPVVNEPVYSNVRGTIAMAKLANNPDSATSQWFINLADNSSNLDLQNGGFTVFGQVAEGGMNVVDTLAAVDTFDREGGFDDFPLRDYSSDDDSNNVDPTTDNVLQVLAIVVTDAASDSAASLTPVENTLISATPAPTPAPDSGSGGGGTMPFALLLLLAGFALLRISPRQ